MQATKAVNQIYKLQRQFSYLTHAEALRCLTPLLNLFLHVQPRYGAIEHVIRLNTPKAIAYQTFKLVFEPERYLSMAMPFLQTKTLSNCRCSGRVLITEVGRHSNNDRERRFSQYCTGQNVFLVEDEFHFPLLCAFSRQVEKNLPVRLCVQTFVNIISDASSKVSYL